ncbi:hypothetical protein [Anaerotignum sp.]|uniref:hypothetical protein n=1 Tax=Anaerotignum sp. TaxID=2039241 RepID=UPI0028A19053|nr:hypothetical protein [Anaerotignum sp.]
MPNIVSGQLTLDDTFTKDIRFRKQSEYRIELLTSSSKATILDIGDPSRSTKQQKNKNDSPQL